MNEVSLAQYLVYMSICGKFSHCLAADHPGQVVDAFSDKPISIRKPRRDASTPSKVRNPASFKEDCK
jgi:hypothetical protein